MSIVNHRAEVRQTHIELVSNKLLKHNWVELISGNLFPGNVGSTSNADGGQNTLNRTGNKIFLKGISMRIIIENQQYRDLCHYQIYILRNKKAPSTNITTSGQMFEGHTSVLPIDYIDTAKVHIAWSKKIVVKNDKNPGTDNAMDISTADGDADGVAEGTMNLMGNPMTIRKFYIPWNKQIYSR